MKLQNLPTVVHPTCCIVRSCIGIHTRARLRTLQHVVSSERQRGKPIRTSRSQDPFKTK